MLVLSLLLACSSTDDSSEAGSDAGLVMLADALDEPDHYCLDIPGLDDDIDFDLPLQAHTCKTPEADDQLVTADHPESGQLDYTAYDRCVVVLSLNAGGELGTTTCASSDSLQRFALVDGTIVPSSDETLCIVVADGKGDDAGGVSNLKRGLGLDACADVEDARKKWTLPAGALGS